MHGDVTVERNLANSGERCEASKFEDGAGITSHARTAGYFCCMSVVCRAAAHGQPGTTIECRMRCRREIKRK
jgi:hypothetical protein